MSWNGLELAILPSWSSPGWHSELELRPGKKGRRISPIMGAEGREAGGQVATASVCTARVPRELGGWAWQGPGRGKHRWRSLLIGSTLGNSVLKVDFVSSGFSSFHLSAVLPRQCASERPWSLPHRGNPAPKIRADRQLLCLGSGDTDGCAQGLSLFWARKAVPTSLNVSPSLILPSPASKSRASHGASQSP